MNEDLGYQQRWYCTYFDAAYAARARVMLESLRAVGEAAPVVAVCFDDEAQEAVRHVPGVTAVPLAELEARYPQLAAVKDDRSRIEYLFTSTPFVMSYTLALASEGAWVTYLDADLWFAANPAPLYEELGSTQVGLIRHDYAPRNTHYERFGVYNVGWVSLRKSDGGSSVARWWALQCSQWCFDYVSGDKFADQGYLNHFAKICPDLAEIEDPGANLAPWNLGTRRISVGVDGAVLSDGAPLLFVHFHGLRRVGRRYFPSNSVFGVAPNPIVRNRLYLPYVRALVDAGDGASTPANRGGRGRRGLWSAAMRWRHHGIAFLRGDTYRV